MFRFKRVTTLLLLLFVFALWSGCEPHQALPPAHALPPPHPLVACNVADCLNGHHNCETAICMPPPGGGKKVCEYAPLLTGACRCVVGDKRPCDGGFRTCIDGGPNETKWSACAPCT